MATAYTPGLSWGAPMRSPEKKKNEWYACELNWNGWYCKPTSTPSPQPSAPDILCTKLIPVPEYVPSYLERSYVWLQMKELPIHVKNQPK